MSSQTDLSPEDQLRANARGVISYAIECFRTIPTVSSDPVQVLLIAAAGLRSLHGAAYEIALLPNLVADLALDLEQALQASEPIIHNIIKTEIDGNRVYLALSAAAELVNEPREQCENEIRLTGYLRAILEARALWLQVQNTGDAKPIIGTTFQNASFGNSKLH